MDDANHANCRPRPSPVLPHSRRAWMLRAGRPTALRAPRRAVGAPPQAKCPHAASNDGRRDGGARRAGWTDGRPCPRSLGLGAADQAGCVVGWLRFVDRRPGRKRATKLPSQTPVRFQRRRSPADNGATWSLVALCQPARPPQHFPALPISQRLDDMETVQGGATTGRRAATWRRFLGQTCRLYHGLGVGRGTPWSMIGHGCCGVGDVLARLAASRATAKSRLAASNPSSRTQDLQYSQLVSCWPSTIVSWDHRLRMRLGQRVSSPRHPVAPSPDS